VVVDGKFTNPTLVFNQRVKFPKNFSRPLEIAWLYKELIALISSYEVDAICIKGMEPYAQKNSLPAVHRIENEALSFLVAANNGIESIERIVDATVATKFKLEARSKRSQAYEICLEKFDKTIDDNTKDAILAAWIRLT